MLKTEQVRIRLPKILKDTKLKEEIIRIIFESRRDMLSIQYLPKQNRLKKGSKESAIMPIKKRALLIQGRNL